MPTVRRALPSLLAVSLLLAACTGDPASDTLVTPPVSTAAQSPPVAPTTTSAATPSASPRPSATPGPCLEQTAALVAQPEPPAELRGDVDGDGVQDGISIARSQDSDPLCATFLVVHSASGTSALPVGEPDIPAGSGLPQLVQVRQVDGRPGAEIVLRVLTGASTEFFGLFSARGGRIARLEAEADGGRERLFASGGSVGHLDGVDCTDPGSIVISAATPQGDRYRVVRRQLSIDGDVFVPLGPPETLTVDAGQLSGFTEFIRSPFGSCPLS